MDNQTTNAGTMPAHDLIVTHTFDAPVQAIWDAWSQALLVQRWWGPNGFHCDLAQVDFREGGTSLVCMEGHGMGPFYNTWRYTAIVPMQSIEYVQHLTDEKGHPIDPTTVGMPADFPQGVRCLLAFDDLGDGRTQLRVTEFGFPSGDFVKLAKQGMEECLEKMAAVVGA